MPEVSALFSNQTGMLGASNKLGMRERQQCWQSPRIAVSNVSDGIESSKNDTDFRSKKPTPNSIKKNKRGGQNQ